MRKNRAVYSLSVCNQAIHGAEVLDDIAASIVRVGSQLLEQLRLVHDKGDMYS